MRIFIGVIIKGMGENYSSIVVIEEGDINGGAKVIQNVMFLNIRLWKIISNFLSRHLGYI